MEHKLTYKIIDKNDTIIEETEKIRASAFNIETGTYYITEIAKGKILVIGAYINNELVGATYLTSSFNCLFVECVFVKKEYQNNKLHVGHSMLKYILEHKEIAEDFFKTKFNICKLESRNKDSFYKRLGFTEGNNMMNTMKRRI